jgi:hypothetical protein
MPLLNGDSVTLDAVSSYPHEVEHPLGLRCVFDATSAA